MKKTPFPLHYIQLIHAIRVHASSGSGLSVLVF